MRKFSAGVVRPEDLRDGPQRETIVEVFEHEVHGCAVLVFESGNQFYCWNNYARILNKAWGYDSEDWLKQELELELGYYTDKKTDTQKETINIRPISPAKTAQNGDAPTGKLPLPPSSGAVPRRDMDDDIPFMCEWR
jgi:hypothetical protein